MCRYIEVMDELEKHKSECEGEELTWTSSCFDRTLEEFNAIRESHPEVDIRVQESDAETPQEFQHAEQVEQVEHVEQAEQCQEENIAREEIPTGLYGGICQLSSNAIKAVFLFSCVIKRRSHILMRDSKCLNRLTKP